MSDDVGRRVVTIQELVDFFDYMNEKDEAEAKAKAKAKEKERKRSRTDFGGYKKKYTVKELNEIASRNHIKITKKLDGKTVNLNKKGLMAKLKRKKLI